MINKQVFLTQTDTTIGFVSQDAEKLTYIKKRPPHKYYIKAVDRLDTLKKMARIPSAHRHYVRRAKQTTFILPNGHSYRLIKDKRHLLLISRMQWAYTTSANLSDHAYDEMFAREHADVIVEPLRGETHPSRIVKLGRHAMKRIR